MSKNGYISILLYIGIGILLTSVITLTLASPILLYNLRLPPGINWSRLGSIGEAYGASSAVLSAFALLAVSVSLFLQRYRVRAERIRIVRDRQTELLAIALENPEIYAPVIGFDRDATPEAIRRNLFANMWMNYSRLGYEMGILTEQMLREEIFPAMFGGEPGRDWWASASIYWHRGKLSRRDLKFVKIASEEFERAIETPVTPLMRSAGEGEMVTGRRGKGNGWMTIAGATLGFSFGLAVGSRVRWR